MRRTALYGRHVDAGARLIDFGGWEMPVQYGGILEEHRAVREQAGLFDLSHMGELWLTGAGAAAGLAAALVSDPTRLAVGRAQYSMIVAPDGGIIDDLIVYRADEDRFLVVPNAGNREVVSAAVAERLTGYEAAFDDASLRTSLVAIQGPAAQAILAPLTDVDLAALALLRHRPRHDRGHPVLAGADRLHGRRRLRAVRGLGRRPGDLGRAAGGGQLGGPGAGRARGSRHAASRGRHAALRQRARSFDQPVRGRARSSRSPRQGR